MKKNLVIGISIFFPLILSGCTISGTMSENTPTEIQMPTPAVEEQESLTPSPAVRVPDSTERKDLLENLPITFSETDSEDLLRLLSDSKEKLKSGYTEKKLEINAGGNYTIRYHSPNSNLPSTFSADFTSEDILLEGTSISEYGPIYSSLITLFELVDRSLYTGIEKKTDGSYLINVRSDKEEQTFITVYEVRHSDGLVSSIKTVGDFEGTQVSTYAIAYGQNEMVEEILQKQNK
jgi:hypothetical protein